MFSVAVIPLYIYFKFCYIFFRYLGSNLIPAIDPMEFCNMTLLTVFSLRSNLLDDDVVPDNAFDCLISLVNL